MKALLRWRLLPLVVNSTALAAVLSLIAKGVAVARLRPVAGFLLLSTAAAICIEVGDRLRAQRARRQMESELPRGVRLTRPLWMSAADGATPVGMLASVAAVVAIFGYPSVGLGIFLTALLFIGGASYFAGGFAPQSLALEEIGLRVFARGVRFLVPWSAISRIERDGPPDRRLIYVRIVDVRSVNRSAEPDTPRARRRVSLMTYDGEQLGGKLMLVPWDLGVDGTVLARAISAAMSGHQSAPN